MRLPSCYESFWLDELHSAWSVWGSWSEVAPRAAAGNQTPPYFWLLWIWKQLLGDSEWVLRLPSVVATSGAAALLTLGLSRTRRGLLGGATAGVLLAMETSSIFYGTELRPFGAVVLLATIACWFVARPVASNGHGTLMVVALTMLAAAIQPTSIGVFGWLLAARLAFMRLAFMRPLLPPDEVQPSLPRRSLRRLPRLAEPILMFIALTLSVAWFGDDVLRNAWRHRTQWQEMGRADSLLQLWQAWPWGAIVLLPGLSLLVIKCSVYLQQGPTVSSSRVKAAQMPWWGLALAMLAAVSTFWLASAMGIAPVFHRRYFVAALPILVWAGGDAVCQAVEQSAGLRWRPLCRSAVAWLLAASPIVALIATQGTAARLYSGDMPLVRRGEGWREAVRYLRQHADPTAAVHVSPGLVETGRLLNTPPSEQDMDAQWYLTYPLSGPYLWPNVHAFDHSSAARSGELPALIRGSRASAQRWVAQGDRVPHLGGARVKSFGGVQVIEKLVASLPNQ